MYGGYVFSYLEFIPGIKPFRTFLGQYCELYEVSDKVNKNNSSMDYHLLEKKLELPENRDDIFSVLTIDEAINMIITGEVASK